MLFRSAGEPVTVVVVAAAEMVSARVGEVLASRFASPGYSATSWWTPAVRSATEIEQEPVESEQLERRRPPSRKVTIPVAPDGPTAAVRRSVRPKLEGLASGVRVVVVVAFATAWLIELDALPA